MVELVGGRMPSYHNRVVIFILFKKIMFIDLLFLEEDTILEDLPSFVKSACQVDQFPNRSRLLSNAFDSSNTLVGCGRFAGKPSK